MKHLELLQNVIARLGNDSFLVKGWAATVAGAFIGFAVTSERPGLALASIVPSLLFWALDATYLRSERLFRLLYERVRRADSAVDEFFMSATDPQWIKSHVKGTPDRAKSSWCKTAVSASLILFYGAIVVSALVVAALLARGDDDSIRRYLAREVLTIECSTDKLSNSCVGRCGARTRRPDGPETVISPPGHKMEMHMRDGLFCRSAR